MRKLADISAFERLQGGSISSDISIFNISEEDKKYIEDTADSLLSKVRILMGAAQKNKELKDALYELKSAEKDILKARKMTDKQSFDFEMDEITDWVRDLETQVGRKTDLWLD